MFGQSKKPTGIISGTAGRVSPYVDWLAHDEKLRRRLATAISGQVAARQRAKKKRAGFLGIAGIVGSNPALRTQVLDAVSQLHKVRGRFQKTESHTKRNSMLALAGAGIVVVAIPKLRHGVSDTLHGRGGSDDSGSDGGAKDLEE